MEMVKEPSWEKGQYFTDNSSFVTVHSVTVLKLQKTNRAEQVISVSLVGM